MKKRTKKTKRAYRHLTERRELLREGKRMMKSGVKPEIVYKRLSVTPASFKRWANEARAG